MLILLSGRGQGGPFYGRNPDVIATQSHTPSPSHTDTDYGLIVQSAVTLVCVCVRARALGPFHNCYISKQSDKVPLKANSASHAN